jgi:protein-S-isoprenylcysteine O-methyltransferase Ste14
MPARNAVRRRQTRRLTSTMPMLLRTLFAVAVYGLLLFVPAWTLDWWRAWVLLALIFTGMIATRLWAFGPDDTLLAERRKPPLQEGQPLADKLLVVGFVVVFPAYIAFIPLDVFRLHLLGKPPMFASSLGVALAIAGWWIISLAFRENAFAVAIVKPQEERGQTVVQTGVYSVVRHPLYSGVVLIVIGIALWLESTAAVVLSIFPIAVIVLRILVEEDFLRRRLRDYDAYAKRVQRRLIPLVW